MGAETQGLGPLDSYQELTVFARRCGESALRLAMHAAVPQSFRADLLHLLKLNFLPDAARDPAVEADVLLADFTEDLSGGYYRFDTEVRRQLLDRLDAAHPQPDGSRLQRVARFLAGYVAREEEKLEASADPLRRSFLEIERWVALAHLDPDSAARQLAYALDHTEAGGTAAVRLQIGGLIRSLSAPLAAHPELLIYAAGLRSLEEGRFRDGQQMLQRLGKGEVQIAGVKLRPVDSVLSEWKGRFEPAARQDAPPAEQSTILIVSESETAFWTAGPLFQRAIDRGFHPKVLGMKEVDFTTETAAINFVTSQSAAVLVLDERFLSLQQDRVSAIFGLPALPVVPVWRTRRRGRPRARENYLSQRLHFGWWAQPIEIGPGPFDPAALEQQLETAVTTIRAWAEDPENALDVAKQQLKFFQNHVLGSSTDPLERFKAMRVAARESFARGDLPGARDLLEKILAALSEAAPDSSVRFRVQTDLAQVLFGQGEFGRARELLELVLSASRETGSIDLQITALATLGELQIRLGDKERAQALLSEAMSLSNQTGDPQGAEVRALLEKLAPATPDRPAPDSFDSFDQRVPIAGNAAPEYVYIAHATQDQGVASSMVSYLERRGIRCWFPSREIRAGGTDWAEEVNKAIKECQVLVLIMSRAGNESDYVVHEVKLAVENRKTVIPVRIDPAQPSAALGYFVDSIQWLDATDAWVSHLPQLYELIKESIDRNRSAPGGTPPDLTGPVVVICSPKDQARAKQLESALDRLGYMVWSDAGDLSDKLEPARLEEARCVLVVWTRNSVSERWLRDAAAEARELSVLIPVRMDGVSLPADFRNLQSANLMGWSGDTSDPAFEDLIQIISLRTHPSAGNAPPADAAKPSIAARIRNWFSGGAGRKIYICYRRTDASSFVYRLRDYLNENLGRGGGVLMRETDSLSLKELETQVRQCEVMLVLIGEKWLFATDRHGRRLLDDPRDVVRNEIQIALENKLIVIPVLLGGAPFLETSALPEPIAKLSQIQAGKLSHEHWDEDFKVLRSAITDRGAQ